MANQLENSPSKRFLDIRGTSGETYDFDEIVDDCRLNEGKRLRMQVYEYEDEDHRNPPDIQVGSIWMSVKKRSD